MKNLSTLISYLVLFIIVVVGFESYGFAPKQLFKTKNFEKYKSSKVFSEIGLTTIAMNDAGLIPGFIEPTNNLNSGTNTALKVVLKNYGQLSLTSVQIPYSINGMIADTFFWSGSLSSAQMDTVIIDSISFIGGVFSIEAYTQLPNNVQDTVNANDTANINVSVCLNGVYSIGDTINGTANFGSFNGALASLNTAGICGNVTFNVEAGTYTEQLTINPINGSSSVHNITFQSANANNTSVVLQYNAIGSSPIHTIHFNGADYISFKDMTIKSLSSDSCKTIVINGGANHITIENNNIIMPVMASNAYGIYSSDGNDNYLNIVDNHIINGVFGIYLKGTSVTSREQWLNIENNHVEDYLAYGIYVFYQDYAVVTGNEVDANTNANYCEGIHFESIYNWFIVKNNKVTTLGGGNDITSDKFGIRIMYCNDPVNAASNTGPGYIYNNMIIVSGNSWTRIGIQAHHNNNVKYYYNSVVISGAGANCKALVQDNIYSSPSGQDFVNNIFINLTSSGYAAYFGSTFSIGLVDNNIYYAPLSPFFVRWFGNRNTIAELQTASGQNLNSKNYLPQFQSATDLHLVSYDALGTGVPVPIVVTDFDGDVRGSVESMVGVDELARLGIDVGVIEIINFPDTTIESYSYPINVRIRNFGTDTLNSFAINYTNNGGAPFTYNYSGSLAPFQYDTVSLMPLIADSLDNTLCVSVVISNDSNALNDTICLDYYGKLHKNAAVSRIVGIDDACSMGFDTIFVWVMNTGIDTINDIGQLGQTTLNYKNGPVANVVSENFDTLIMPGDSIFYAFSTLLDFSNNSVNDSLFNIYVWIEYPGDGSANNDTAYTSVNSLSTIGAPVFTTPLFIPYATDVNISVGSPHTVLWYDSDNTPYFFNQGSTYATPVMFASDTFWLQALPNGAIFKLSETVQFKSVSGIVFPSNFPSGDFDGIEISNVSSVMGDISGYEVNIYLSNSEKISYIFPNGTFLDSGAVVCALYGTGLPLGPQGNNIFNISTISSIYSMSLVSYWLKDPDGNIVDAFASNGAVFPAYSGVISSDFAGQLTGSSGKVGAIRLLSDNNSASDWGLITPANFSFGNYNSQLPLEGGEGCIANAVQMILSVGLQQNTDISIQKLASPVSVINLTTSEIIKVQVNNYGLAMEDSIPIAYQVNNGLIVWDTIYSSIAPNDSLEFEFTVGADLSIVGSIYSIKVFSACLNDTNQLNDTLIKSVTNILPDYCISKSVNNSGLSIIGCSIYPWSTTSPNTYSSYSDFKSITPYPVVTKGITTAISVSSNKPTYMWDNAPCYANVFIDLNRDGQFTTDERVFGGATTPDNTLSGSINIPNNTITGLTYMRVVLQESGNINTTGPCGTYTNGETEDYAIMIADKLTEDVVLDSIMFMSNFIGTANNNLNVRIINHGYDVIDSLSISYVLNGGAPVTTSFNTLSMVTLDTLILSLGQINYQLGENTLLIYTSLPTDSNNYNDTIFDKFYLQHSIMPDYSDDFEGNSIWLGNTFGDSHWNLGAGMNYSNGTHSPVNAWVFYYANWNGGVLDEYLYTPHFNTIGQDSALLSFWHTVDSYSSYVKSRLEFSVNNGPWHILGSSYDPNGTNWYNGGFTYSWGSNQNWTESSYKLDLTNTIFNSPNTIQFRFLGSVNRDAFVELEWVIDDFSFNILRLQQDVGVIAILDPDTSISMGTNVTVSIDIKNFGSDTIFNVPVSYSVGANTVHDTMIVPSPGLLPDDTTSFTFSTGFIAPNTPIQICAKTEMNDPKPSNDEICKQLSIGLPPIDISVIDFAVSPSWHDTTKVSFDDTVHVRVVNLGADSLMSINFKYYSTFTSIQSNEIWSGSLASLDTLSYSFVNTYKSPASSYLVCVKAIVIGDYDVSNNEVCSNYIGIDNVGFSSGVNNGFSVTQNQPNPATGSIIIYYIIPQAGDVQFEIRNALGQLMLSKVSIGNNGKNSIEYDASELVPGVYYYTVTYNKQQITKKMLVQ